MQSQAIKANGFVFVSGQMPATLEDGKIKLTEGTVGDKAHAVCRNAATVLEAAGSSLEKVVKVTVFFANLDDFAEFNEVYGGYFPQRPARSAIEAKRLPAGVTLEMELIAVE
ncbi:endoribonuclease L-PSP [Cladophialophora psammophila CBS 110553]|uniref:Endoribonuclease L-PSP n=1 Tax=Cladophialophora psammophila CBS 110553 TaxID=1182543 RepID=W9X8D5_9EURO|nr:endoribonuclease L-PSP [Cladophialophora psammophila CBS 110553]EXJ73590.1 endoribonuclease L-PSP [Cladophialophora psammophila CBS 110553]